MKSVFKKLSIASILILIAYVPLAIFSDHFYHAGYHEVEMLPRGPERPSYMSGTDEDYYARQKAYDDFHEARALREESLIENSLRKMQGFHLVVTAVSLPYFVFTCVALFLYTRRYSITKPMLIVLRALAVASLFMAAWSCALSRTVHFGEVVYAFVPAALLTGGVACILWRKMGTKIAPKSN
jgi:hypothetical protein